MIEIHKITDSETLGRLIAKYKLKAGNNDIFTAVLSGSDILEFVQYRIEAGLAEIIYLSDNTNDFMLIDGLLKTVLFTIDTADVKFILLPKCYERAGKALGFKGNGKNYVLRPDEYRNCCERKD